MAGRKGIIPGVVALSCLFGGCSKSGAVDQGGAVAVGSTAATDHKADAATINRLDSAWMRYIVARNVDSIMTEYMPDAVTYYSGVPTANGTDQIRAAYSEMTKYPITEAKVASNTIKFSDDGTMAVDHGTSTMTATSADGKKSTMLGSYVNVWMRSGNTWKIAVDMSQPAAAPKK